MNRRFGYKKSAIIDISMTAKNYFLSRRSSISNKFNFVLVPLKTISKFYLQYYKFPNISIFLIAKECMFPQPNRNIIYWNFSLKWIQLIVIRTFTKPRHRRHEPKKRRKMPAIPKKRNKRLKSFSLLNIAEIVVYLNLMCRRPGLFGTKK